MRRRRVLIHVDQQKRDAVPMLWLKMLLEERGVSVRLCNRLSRERMFYSFLPDVFLQSHVFFDSATELKRKACIAKHVLLPTEGAVFDPNPINAHFSAYPQHNELFSKVLAWGNAYKRVLVESGHFDDARVSVVGSPRFDVYRNYSRETVSNGKIGFVSSLVLLNAFDRRSIFKMIDNNRGGESVYYDINRNVEDLYWVYIAQCRVLFEIFDRWFLAEKKSGVFRPHPNENRDLYLHMVEKYRGLFHLDDGEHFYGWLKKLEGLVMFQSTTAVEAILARKPFITLEKIIGTRIDDHLTLQDARLPYVQCSWEPRTVDEAVDFMMAMSKGELPAKEPNEEIKKVLADMYDWPRERGSLEHIADEIMSLMAIEGGAGAKNNIKKSFFSTIVHRIKLLRVYVWRWIGYVVNRQNYTHDMNYHYFPWNFRQRRDAKKTYLENLECFRSI